MSKLKTVWDAVNELRGDLNNAARADTQTYLKFSLVTHTWLCSASSIANHSYEDVCTIAEFNALVDSMSRHAGDELYERYVRVAKTPLKKESEVDYTPEEFWKDAPEGATHHCGAHNEFSEVWIKDLKEDSYSFRVVGSLYASDEWRCTNPIVRDELKYLTPRPQPKPVKQVYTQAMADNGELPKVGMKCLFKMNGEYKTITVLYNSQEVMVFSYTFDGVMVEDARVKSFNNIDIKPIDQRTKKEKAIDEIESELSKIAYSTRSALELAYDEWVGE